MENPFWGLNTLHAKALTSRDPCKDVYYGVLHHEGFRGKRWGSGL